VVLPTSNGFDSAEYGCAQRTANKKGGRLLRVTTQKINHGMVNRLWPNVYRDLVRQRILSACFREETNGLAMAKFAVKQGGSI
jgi:hypothetical protein